MKKRILSSTQIKKIEQMAEMGLPDVEIAERLNLPFSTVNPRTTRYWKNKMSLKYD